MLRIHSALALICFGAACTFSLDRSLSPGQIRGQVVYLSSSGTQKPATDAQVMLEASNVTTTTDGTGHFTISNLPPATYALDLVGTGAAAGNGLRLQGINLPDIGNGVADGMDLGTIVLGAFGGISGTVVLGGNPVIDATVLLSGISQTTPSADGFSFPDLLPGTYDVSVFYAGSTGAQVVTVPEVAVLPRAITPVGPIDLSSVPSTSEGSVAGAAVAIGSTASITVQLSTVGFEGLKVQTQSGLYEAPSLAPGIYTVTAELASFPSVTVPFIVVGGDTTQVPTITISAMAAPDAGPEDAGTSDAGLDGGIDAGPDAGFDGGLDAGSDAGLSDAGSDGGVDAGSGDAGEEDAGGLDGGIWIGTIAGNGFLGPHDGTGTSSGSAQFGHPSAVVTDSAGNRYVADSWSTPSIRKIDQQGNVTTLFPSDGGDDPLSSLGGLAVDPEGNIDIADLDGCVWQLSPAGTLVVFAGNCEFNDAGPVVPGIIMTEPIGIAIDGEGSVYVSDIGASVIYKFARADGGYTFGPYAGTEGMRGLVDGKPGELARPNQIAFAPMSSALYVADEGNSAIRAVAPDGTLSIVAIDVDGGTPLLTSVTGVAIDVTGNVFFSARSGIGEVVKNGNSVTVSSLTNIETNGFLDGPAGPEGPALVGTSLASVSLDFAGNLMFPDASRIRSMSVAAGAVGITSAAPAPMSPNSSGLTSEAIEATSGEPLGVAIASSGDLFLSAGADVYECTAASIDGGNCFDTEEILSRGVSAWGIAASSAAAVYVAVSGRNVIERVEMDGGTSVVAGSGVAGFEDGMATVAEFNAPQGVAVDSAGNIFVADTQNNRIREISTSGDVSTFAGTGVAGLHDGANLQAEFFHPYNLTADATGTVFVADTGNSAIRQIKEGAVTTLVGNGAPGNADGLGGAHGTARLNLPGAVAEDALGHLIIMDTWNGSVRVYDPGTDMLSTVVPEVGNTTALAVDASGRGYFAEPAEGWIILQYTCSGTWCGPSCFALESDPGECGTCGTPCAADPSAGSFPACVEGKCSAITQLSSNPTSGGSTIISLAGDTLYWQDTGNLVATTAASGGTPSTLITGLNAIDFATDGTNLYAAVGPDVVQIQPGGAALTLASTGASSTASVVSVAADSTTVYWTTSDGQLLSLPSSPSANAMPTQMLAGQPFGQSNNAATLLVDDANLYWEALNDSDFAESILATPKSGAGVGTVVTLASDLQANGTGPFALNTSAIFWTNNPGIASAPLTGTGVVTQVATDYSETSGLAADDSYVYWSNAQTGVIFRQTLGGSDVVTIASQLDAIVTQPGALTLDATHLYWLDLTNQYGSEALSIPR